ncbi:MAG: hypothetical protein ABI873_04730 [Marmoricola sp.]
MFIEPSTRARPKVGRRTVVRSVVWSAPVIAIAAPAPAPAFAASCTQLYAGTLNWASPASYTRNSTTSGTGSITASNGQVIGVTLASTFANYSPNATSTDNTPNLGVTTPVGGTGASGLTICQNANGTGTSSLTNNPAFNQSLQVRFNRTVRNVSFTLTDVDSGAGQYLDAIVITGAAFSSSFPAGSTVIGTGTTTSNPFRQSSPNTPYDNGVSPGGNVLITLPGPLTAFTIVYWNAIPPANVTVDPTRQTVFVSNMSASVFNAGCP